MKKDIGPQLAELNRMIHRHIIKHNLSDAHQGGSNRGGKATMASACIIGYLYNHRDTDIYQRDLEEQLEVRRSTLSKELSLMEQKGFIKRESLSNDRRLKKIVLCEKSLHVAQKLNTERRSLEHKMTNGISADELEKFCNTLQKLIANLKEDNK